MRGWPAATIVFYGPNLSRATKVAVGIVPSEGAEPAEMRDWKVETGDVRADTAVAGKILGFIQNAMAPSQSLWLMASWAARTRKASTMRGNGAHLPTAHSGMGATALRGSQSNKAVIPLSDALEKRPPVS